MRLAHLPTVAEQVPAGVLGPKALTVDAQAVPTSVTVGPDGALYVGLLRGVPSAPGTAMVYRLLPGHAPTVYAKGLSAVTSLAFLGHDLLATELSTGGLMAVGKAPGALVEVPAGSRAPKVVALGVPLFAPTGLAVDHGTVYVANGGVLPAKGPKTGEVLAVRGL